MTAYETLEEIDDHDTKARDLVAGMDSTGIADVDAFSGRGRQIVDSLRETADQLENLIEQVEEAAEEPEEDDEENEDEEDEEDE